MPDPASYTYPSPLAGYENLPALPEYAISVALDPVD